MKEVVCTYGDDLPLKITHTRTHTHICVYVCIYIYIYIYIYMADPGDRAV
jgi:hypothetical protein